MYSSRDIDTYCNGVYSMLVRFVGLWKYTSSDTEYPVDGMQMCLMHSNIGLHKNANFHPLS